MPGTPSHPAEDRERTVAVLYGPEQSQYRHEVEMRIVEAGFQIVGEASVVAEELEEAGLSLPDGTGEDVEHIALVLERKSAVAVWKALVGEGRSALNKSSLAAAFPDLKLFAAPSPSAARMSIGSLFPHMQLGASASTPVSAPALSNDSATPVFTPSPSAATHSRANPPSFPFALSNLSHPSPPRSADLSPSVARALRKLEMNEEDLEKRKSSSTIGAGSTPEPKATPSDDARRVFTYHSRETTATTDFGAEGSEGEVESMESESYADEYDAGGLDEYDTEQAELDAVEEEELEALHFAGEEYAAAIPFNPDDAAPLSIPSSHTRTESVTTDGTTPSSASAHSATSPRVVKSLGAPSIVPRGNKASQRRAGSMDASAPLVAKVRRAADGTAGRYADPLFAGTPGHRRRESIQVSSTAKPRIEPRLTKAAALRAGIVLPPVARQRSATSASAESEDSSPSKTPAENRRQSITVKSTAPPLVAPRQTKASALRAGVEATPKAGKFLANVTEDEETTLPARRPRLATAMSYASTSEASSLSEALPRPPRIRATVGTSGRSAHPAFENVPGHKRRESIQVASTARPSLEPRMSRAALLRAGTGELQSPAMRRASMASVPVSFEGVPGHRRRESIAVASVSRAPSIAPRLNRASMLRKAPGSERDPLSTTVNRVPVVTARATHIPPRAGSALSTLSVASTSKLTPAPVRKPVIAPRSNKSAELRAAKKEADALATLKALKAKTRLRPATVQGILSSGLPSITGQRSPRGISPKTSFARNVAA